MMNLGTEESAVAERAAAPRILVVEDEPMVAIMLEEALRDFGYQVIGPVENYRAAVQLAASERIDAAVVDINLAGQVADAVADNLLERHIPFMFVSGYARATGLRYSDVPLLRKPFTIDDLHRGVEALLARGASAIAL